MQYVCVDEWAYRDDEGREMSPQDTPLRTINEGFDERFSCRQIVWTLPTNMRYAI